MNLRSASSILLLLAACGCTCEREEQSAPGAGPRAEKPAVAPSALEPVPPAPEATAVPEPEPVPAPKPLVVIAGGDVNLAPLLEPADLRLVNLESQLSDQNGETQAPHNRLIFTGPPGGGRVLANALIDVVSIANNHAWDYRKPAFLETLDNLSKAGVGFVGGSATPMQQYKPYVFEKNGWSVALFAVTHIWNQGPIEQHPGRHHVAWARYDKLHREIEKAEREHDLVMLSYHGGGEYIDVPMLETRDFVKAVMNAGVDVVFGHHPHVVHGVSWFDERPAFYSLGNLVFNQHKHYPWTGTGFLARMTFTRDAPPKVEACPFHIVGHIPTLYAGKAREPLEQAFRRRLKIVSITVGGTSVSEPGEHSCMQLTPPAEKT